MIADNYLADPVNKSISIGVIKGNEQFTFCYGNTCESAPFTQASPYSVYEIGSITKVFTGILLAQEVNAGRMNLDDAIAKHLESVSEKPELNNITLKQLATHSSGLPRLATNFWNCVKDPGNPYAGYSEDDLKSFLKNIELEFPVGSSYHYSNVGMGLLGWLISKERGSSYESLVQERITGKIGMDHTAATLNDLQKRNLSTGFSKGKAVKSWDFQNCTSGQGSLRSNLMDMLKFAKLNLHPGADELGEAVRSSQEVHFTDPETHQKMGLGWHIGGFNGQKYLEHTGGTGGYRSFIGIVPGSDIAVIVLSNSDKDVAEAGLKVLETVMKHSQM